MESFNVHWKFGESKGKALIFAFSKEDAKIKFERYARTESNSRFIPFEATVTKIYGPLGRESTPKQKLAQRYGFIIGSIKGAKKQFNTTIMSVSPDISTRVIKGQILVDAQFAKLQRDIRDVFKLAGLKVK